MNRWRSLALRAPRWFSSDERSDFAQEIALARLEAERAGSDEMQMANRAASRATRIARRDRKLLSLHECQPDGDSSCLMDRLASAPVSGLMIRSVTTDNLTARERNALALLGMGDADPKPMPISLKQLSDIMIAALIKLGAAPEDVGDFKVSPQDLVLIKTKIGRSCRGGRVRAKCKRCGIWFECKPDRLAGIDRCSACERVGSHVSERAT